MPKRKKKKKKNPFQDYLNCCPEWYWVYGLHDAQIVNILREELLIDYNNKDPEYNRMEILLDCNNETGEENITKIILYNHSIVSGKLPNCDQGHIWWIDDKLLKSSDNSFKLELEFADEMDKRYYSEIIFEFAEVFRKQ